MIGEILAHYEIVGKIGAGGMGEVYRARDPLITGVPLITTSLRRAPS